MPIKSDIFSPAALDKIIQSTLPPVGSSQQSSALVGAVDKDGVQVVASFRKKQQGPGFAWELQGAAQHKWTGDNVVGGKVILTW